MHGSSPGLCSLVVNSTMMNLRMPVFGVAYNHNRASTFIASVKSLLLLQYQLQIPATDSRLDERKADDRLTRGAMNSFRQRNTYGRNGMLIPTRSAYGNVAKSACLAALGLCSLAAVGSSTALGMRPECLLLTSSIEHAAPSRSQIFPWS